MLLFWYYLCVSAGYLALTLSNRDVAVAIFPWVALMLLIPAVYDVILQASKRRNERRR